MNNAIYVKMQETINILTTGASRIYLISNQIYHITKIFSNNLSAIEMKITHALE